MDEPALALSESSVGSVVGGDQRARIGVADAALSDEATAQGLHRAGVWWGRPRFRASPVGFSEPRTRFGSCVAPGGWDRWRPPSLGSCYPSPEQLMPDDESDRSALQSRMSFDDEPHNPTTGVVEGSHGEPQRRCTARSRVTSSAALTNTITGADSAAHLRELCYRSLHVGCTPLNLGAHSSTHGRASRVVCALRAE